MLRCFVAQLDYGVFTISLDFELYWGCETYAKLLIISKISWVRQAAPAMLRRFLPLACMPTWATVGLLFCQDHVDALNQAPDLKPAYRRTELSPYRYLSEHTLLDPDLPFCA